ncbi:glycosyl transferase family 1 [Alteromonas macleodii]|jgi:glycosyltransferase involved in cell wall biosynthesis|uniref:glycosyltransferase n=1 Tax=Alteromonas macleodii TaxID=28108 RepID=UPI00057CAC89|nr:glycosyltransferase [Alteromonas macleodii]KHT53017.1 glycosyl transferase family 1 [Alteromonas macleodii]
MEKRKVFFLINSIGFGGAERALVNLLSVPSLYSGLDVRIILLDKEPLVRQLPSTVKVHQLNAKRSLLFSLVQLNALVRKEKPTLIVSFLVRANVANAITTLFQNHSAVLCERMHLTSHLDNQFTGWMRAVAGAIPRISYGRASAVLGVSRGVTKDLVEHFHVSPGKAHTIYNPYNIDDIRAASKETPSISLPSRFIVSAGRLTEAKNFKHLINAYLKSSERDPLCILGEGEQKEALAQFIKKKGAEKRVLLVGYAKNPFSVFSRAKYYISASTNEGFPNALLEAMTVGLPVVMTNCPSGPAEILDADPDFQSDKYHFGKYGILVPLGDERELVYAINQMQIEDVRVNYSSKSKLRAEDFCIGKISAEYWQFLRRFL